MACALDIFIDFLLSDLEASGNTTFVDSLLANAQGAITGRSDLGFIQTGSLNGKSFSRSKELSALEIAFACRRALELYGGSATPLVYADFSNLIPGI